MSLEDKQVYKNLNYSPFLVQPEQSYKIVQCGLKGLRLFLKFHGNSFYCILRNLQASSQDSDPKDDKRIHHRKQYNQLAEQFDRNL